jgi:hypothetical protein
MGSRGAGLLKLFSQRSACCREFRGAAGHLVASAEFTILTSVSFISAFMLIE